MLKWHAGAKLNNGLSGIWTSMKTFQEDDLWIPEMWDEMQ